MKKPYRFAVQHEFDHEATYVVERENPQGDGEPVPVATFDPQLPWEVRLPLARLTAHLLNGFLSFKTNRLAEDVARAILKKKEETKHDAASGGPAPGA